MAEVVIDKDKMKELTKKFAEELQANIPSENLEGTTPVDVDYQVLQLSAVSLGILLGQFCANHNMYDARDVVFDQVDTMLKQGYYYTPCQCPLCTAKGDKLQDVMDWLNTLLGGKPDSPLQ